MIIIPAIDIMGNKVVRLMRGKPSSKKEYAGFENPFLVAKHWQELGAEYIHVIDLDAALGKGDNRTVIRNILKKVNIPCQVGGGLRSLDLAKMMLDNGAGRIILGSMAIMKPERVKILIEKYGIERIVVSLDHSAGKVLINGWKKGTSLHLNQALSDFKRLGVHWFLVTSVERDGTLSGPDFETFERIAGKAGIIASGGIRDVNDLLKLKETGVEATVVGKALYEDRFTLKQATSTIGGN